ncbi:MAG: hypothetical protein FVQ82_13220 [Planctomycetes bacterium]|nr:hypothetical protein [Planctomycetota bacterium]
MSESYSFLIETPLGNYELKAETEQELQSWNSTQTTDIIRGLIKSKPKYDSETFANNKYRLTFKTPYGCYQIEADSAARLILLSSPKTTMMVETLIGSESEFALGLAIREVLRPCDGSEEEDYNLDIAAKEALAIYYKNKGKPARHSHGSTIYGAGVELDLIKCYLQDMTAKQIIEWLKNNRSFDTNSSTVGRYTRLLWGYGVRPIRKAASEVSNE